MLCSSPILNHTNYRLEPKLTIELLANIHKYRQIDGHLSTSGQPSIKQLVAIANAGFQTIINLALHDDPRYSLPDEPGVVASLGLKYVHIPVQFSAPTTTDLHAFFNAMEADVSKMIWVHCAANIRVSAFLGLYRVLKQGWNQDDAFALMHGLWEPDQVWSTFIKATLANAQA